MINSPHDCVKRENKTYLSCTTRNITFLRSIRFICFPLIINLKNNIYNWNFPTITRIEQNQFLFKSTDDEQVWHEDEFSFSYAILIFRRGCFIGRCSRLFGVHGPRLF